LIQVRHQPRSVLLPLAGDVVAGGYPDCPISLYSLRSLFPFTHCEGPYEPSTLSACRRRRISHVSVNPNRMLFWFLSYVLMAAGTTSATWYVDDEGGD